MQMAGNAFAPVTMEDCRAACYFAGAARLTVAAKPAPQYVQPWGYDCHSGHRSGREVVRPRTSPSMPSHSISH